MKPSVIVDVYAHNFEETLLYKFKAGFTMPFSTYEFHFSDVHRAMNHSGSRAK